MKKSSRRSPYNVKRKFIATIAMLLVATILLLSTSFAWLVLSTAPEVTGIRTNIGSNGALEIALLNSETYMNLSKIRNPGVGESLQLGVSTANYSWGNIVDLNQGEFGLNNITLLPARLNISASSPNKLKDATSILSVPNYGYDGVVLSVTNDTLTAVYDGEDFNYIVGSPDYGVRAIGTSSQMSVQSAAMTTAKTNIKNYKNGATTEARAAMSANGAGLFTIIINHSAGSDSFSGNDLQAIKKMIEGLQRSSDYIEDAIRQGLIVVAAANITDTSSFEQVRNFINDKSLSEIKKQFGNFGLNAGSINSLIDEWHVLDNNIKNANDAVNDLQAKGNTYTWAEIKGVLALVMNIDGNVTLNDTPISQIDQSIINEQIITLKLYPGTGIFADIADFVGTYDATLSAMGKDVIVNVYQEENPSFLDKLVTTTNDMNAANGNSTVGAKLPLESTYGYAIDLAFRTNAAVSNLLLQTIATQRVNGDSSETATMGGGSFMEFNISDTDMTAMETLRLVDAVRVAFLTDNGTILGIAKPNTSNYSMTAESIKAPIYLYSYHVSNDGALIMDERLDKDNELTALQKNTAKAITAIVWLDGDTIDNTMVPAEDEIALGGMLNLQFASSADLIPADINGLKDLTGNKSDLEAQFEEATVIYDAGQGNYTSKSWRNFITAYTRVQEVINTTNASESIIHSASVALFNATKDLTVSSKTALKNQIDTIRQKVGKTTDIARIVVENDGRYFGIDTYTEDQLTNNKGIIYRVDYNKNLKDEGNGIMTQLYTDESWQALAATLYETEVLLLDPAAPEKEIDDAITALETSYGALSRKVFYIPYLMNDVLYYKAIVAADNTDKYGVWYDSNFKRILNELTMIELEATADEFNAANILMDDYFKFGSTDKINDISVELADVFKNQNIVAIRWEIPSIFENSLTTAQKETVSDLRVWAYRYLYQTADNQLYFNEVMSLYNASVDTYEQAEIWIITMNKYKDICDSEDPKQSPANTDPMTFNQRVILTKSVNAAKLIEGYSENTALMAEVEAAESLLNNTGATVADATTRIEALNVQIVAAGGTRVTEASLIEYIIPVGSEKFDIAYGTTSENSTHTAVTVAPAAHGDGTVTAIVLTDEGIVIKATKTVNIYHQVAGVEISSNKTAVDSTTLEQGDQVELDVSLIPSIIGSKLYTEEKIEAVSWSSTNTDILIAEGVPNSTKCVVTAVNKGTARVKVVVTTEQGNRYTGEINVPVITEGLEGLSYTLLDDNTCYIDGIGNYVGTEVIIPDKIDGYLVTGIGQYAFSGCTHITSITIPNSVTNIGVHAFSGCTGLTSIDLPDHLNSIGSYAFYNCTGIYTLGIPDSVTTIGNYAFAGCKNLQDVVISDSVTSIGDYAFSGCENIDYIGMGDHVSTIGNSAFSGCNKLSSVYISDLAAWCNIDFYNFTSNPTNAGAVLYLKYEIDDKVYHEIIHDLVIPSTITNIGEYAFAGCSGITSVTIPENVKRIESNAFSGCTELTSVHMSSSVTNIDDAVFSGCENLSSIYYIGTINQWNAISKTNNWWGIDTYTIYCYTDIDDNESPIIEGIIIGDGVTSLDGYNFVSFDHLENVVIGKGITKIPSSTFANCKNLKNVVIPNGVTSIGKQAFYGCSSLTSIVIPDSVTSIGDYAFDNCDSLTNIAIPDSVTKIGQGAFDDCDSLTSIVIPDSVTSIDDWTFADCTNLASIVIPDSVTSIGGYAFTGCTNLNNIIIPESVTSISQGAFYDCSSLTNIVISKNVTNIGAVAFKNCSSLKSIVIPESVTSIGSCAFEDCSGLTNVTFEGTKAQWDAISKVEDWDNNTGNYIISCVDGIIEDIVDPAT